MKKRKGIKRFVPLAMVCCCLLLGSALANAQDSVIQGQVLDESNSPLSNINVKIKEVNKGTVTDSLGYFKLAGLENKSYNLVFSAIGFTTVQKELKPNESVSVTLKSKFTELMDVQVFGSKAKNGFWVDTASLGPLAKVSWQKNPFSIYTVTEERINNLQASNLTDVLKAQPTIQSQTGGSRVTDYFTSRGFTSSVWTNNTAVEGLISHNPVEPMEDKARVEVMNGPNSLLYGITSPGGMVNSLLKRPTSETLLNATVGDYGGKQAFAHVDAGGPITKSLGYRLNGVYVNNGETNVENQTHERYLASVALDWKITPKLKWEVDASLFNRDAEHTQSILAIGTATKAPDAPDASKNYGSAAGFAKDSYTKAGSQFSWIVNSALSFKAAFRYTEFSREYAFLRRDMVGDATFKPRVTYAGKNKNYNPQGYALANYKLNTGKVKQSLTLSYVADFLKTDVPETNSTVQYKGKTAIALFDPFPEVPAFDATVNSSGPFKTKTQTDSRSVAFLDNISIGKKVNVIAGLTYASIAGKNWDATTWKSTSDYKSDAFSPGAAIIYSPKDFLSFYGSYIQALQDGGVVPTDANCLNSGETLSPYISHQQEIGIKATLGQVHVHLAAFRIEQANAFNDSTTNGQYRVVQDGREVHTGTELTVQGIVFNSLSVSFGATLLNPKITKTSTPALKDKEPIGVAKAMGKLSLEYALPFIKRFYVNGTLNYTGKQWVNTANSIDVPAVTTTDLGVRYKLPVKDHALIFRGTVTNVGDVSFWATRNNTLYWGDPRTVAFSVAFAW